MASVEESRGTQSLNPRLPSAQGENPLYYLHPGENPALVLVTPALSASNYLSWSRSMKRALRSKKKWSMVDGSIPPPDFDDDEYEEWESCNSMVLSWLLGSMEPAIARSVSCLELAAAVWADMKSRFGRGDSMKIARLQSELCSLKQGALSVTNYFTVFRTLWDDFCEFRPIALCKCVDSEKGSTLCESVRINKLYQENDQVIRFLIGLNENYSTVISQIMLMDPLPDVNRTLFLALQHEQQLLNGTSMNLVDGSGFMSDSRFGSVSSMSNAVNTSGYGSWSGKKSWNKNKKLAVCTYGGKDGHTIDKCYRKHSFPPNFKFTNTGPAPGRQQGNQSSGGLSYGNSYAINRGYQYSANQVSTDGLQEVNEGLAKLALTQEQYSGLVALIQHSTGSFPGPSHQPFRTADNSVHCPVLAHANSVGVTPISGPNPFESDW